MITNSLRVPVVLLAQETGWEVNADGACHEDRCVALPPGTLVAGQVDLKVFAERLGMPLLHDACHELWSLGPEAASPSLGDMQAPELHLPLRNGDLFRLSALRGKKVLLVAWASWCGCRLDLPAWQALRTELAPAGFELLSVALDTAGWVAAGPFVPDVDFPVVVDQANVLGERFGVTNVPSGIWIDENGVIVRPPETAYPARPTISHPDYVDPHLTETLPPADLARRHAVRAVVRRLRFEPEQYVGALRDWVAKGADSRYCLSPEQILARTAVRGTASATAAAAFSLGQHLHRTGHAAASVRWFRESHRLAPDNWVYRRQAWSLVDPLQGPTEEYDGDWLSDVTRIGAENYYPPLEMDPQVAGVDRSSGA